MAIKATELRIGNIVSLFDIGKPEIISTIGKSVIQIESGNGNAFEIKEIQPFAITEEWLLEFGFEKIEDKDRRIGFRFFFDNLLFVGMKIDDKISLVCKALGAEIGTPIYYVHQLQNTYFALTGEELTIQ